MKNLSVRFLLIACVALLSSSAVAENCPLPPDAEAVMGEYRAAEKEVTDKARAQIRSIQDKAHMDLEPARREAARKLQALQDQYTRSGQLDEALTLRQAVREVLGISPDPGILHLTKNQVDKILLFEVRGATSGSLWGDEVYTGDSHLGTAAVHSGVLKPSQKGLVKVRVLPGQQSYRSATRHGVTSQPYGAWHVSFTIESVKTER